MCSVHNCDVFRSVAIIKLFWGKKNTATVYTNSDFLLKKSIFITFLKADLA